MEIVLSFAWKGIDILPPRTLPPKALVLALTPLLDARSARRSLDLRARGFDLVVIEVSPVPFVDAGHRRARRSSRTGCGGCRASRCASRYQRPACRSSSGATASRSHAALEEVTAFRRYARPARA